MLARIGNPGASGDQLIVWRRFRALAETTAQMRRFWFPANAIEIRVTNCLR